MSTSLMTVKGQTTIPKKIREYLNLQPGDKIDFVVDEKGKVILEPASRDIKELEGILHDPERKAVSIEEMKNVIHKRFGRN
jgi:antitoxin PrlF